MPSLVWFAALLLHSVGPPPTNPPASPPPPPPPATPAIAPPAAPAGALRLTATWGDTRLKTPDYATSIVSVGTQAFATGNRHSMHLWSSRTGDEIAAAPLQIDYPIPVASADGKLVAVEHSTDVTAIFDVATRHYIKAVPIGRPLWLVDGGALLVGFREATKTYELWDVAATRKLWERTGRLDQTGVRAGAWMSANEGMFGFLASADGRFAAAISYARPRCDLVVMDLRTLAPRHKAPVGCPLALRFAGDTRLVAAGEELAVWDFEKSKTPRLVPLAAPAKMEGAAVSPREDRVVEWTARDITVWSAAGGKRLWTKPRPAAEQHQTVAATFSADGRQVIATGWGKAAFLIAWDAETGRQLYARTDVTALADRLLAFDAGGRMAMAGRGNHIVLLDAATGEPNTRPPRFTGYVTALALARDGRLLAAGNGSGDGSLALIDTRTGTLANVFRRPDPEYRSVTDMAFSADGNEVVAAIDGQKGRYAETWTLATGQLARTIGAAGSSTGSSSFSRVRILDGGARVVTEEVRPAEVGELQDGAHIMTTYELATGKTISRWRVRRPPDDRLLLDQATADAGEAALFGPAGKSVRIVDVGTGDSKRSFDLPPRTGVLALSRDGRLLAALADDGGGSVLEARSGKTLRNLKGAAGSSPMVAFSP